MISDCKKPLPTGEEKATPSDTRDAVETSIDLSKGDPEVTWERLVREELGSVGRWGETHARPASRRSSARPDTRCR